MNINFIRVITLKHVVDYANKVYRSCDEAIGIPPYLLDEPLRFIPQADYFNLLERIEEFTEDELYSARLSSTINMDRPSAPLANYILSAGDLLTAIKRSQYLFYLTQTGMFLNMMKVGNIIKWRYETTPIPGKGQSHHSVLMVAVPVRLFQWFHGESYMPLSIHLTGSPLGRPGEVEALFGCPVFWNAPRTEVWFPFSDLVCHRPETRPQLQIPHLSMDKLMAFMDMPPPNDFKKTVAELINYARFFGFPRLEFIAQKLGVSPLKLQRKLQEYEMTFTDMVQGVLCLEAIEMMKEGRTFEDITQRLGFKNTQTFAKAFKRLYGQTPTQFRMSGGSPEKTPCCIAA